MQAANISKERLASFDRPIKSEPKFSKQQCPGLKKDLAAYLQTLKASCCPKCLYTTQRLIAATSQTCLFSGKRKELLGIICSGCGDAVHAETFERVQNVACLCRQCILGRTCSLQRPL